MNGVVERSGNVGFGIEGRGSAFQSRQKYWPCTVFTTTFHRSPSCRDFSPPRASWSIAITAYVPGRSPSKGCSMSFLFLPWSFRFPSLFAETLLVLLCKIHSILLLCVLLCILHSMSKASCQPLVKLPGQQEGPGQGCVGKGLGRKLVCARALVEASLLAFP